MTTTIPIPDVTRTCQPGPDFTSADLLAALEAAWAAIRHRHREVPAVVVVVGSGSPTRASQSMKWGHFAALRWQAGTDRLPEVLVSGEGLSRPAEQVFTTLLHEATHALADARGVKDTSRQGRWHNKHFATLAHELGMTTTKDPKLGYSPCTLTDPTRTSYAEVITTLGRALRAYRHPEPHGPAAGRTSNNNGLTAECDCPRRIRLSPKVFDTGPVLCVLCHAVFLPEGIDRDAYHTEHAALLHPITQPSHVDDHDRQPDEEGDEHMFCYDPTGARYGLPTYPYRFAPQGLATRRQLRARNLRPGGQQPAAQILWRRGQRKAYLYRIDLAAPKRAATPAQHAAIAKALLARRTCPTCQAVKDYYIPRRYGECLDCHPAGTP